MKKIFAVVMAIFATVTLSGCIGERVTVAPNEVGKILTPNGFKKGVIPTSTFRLDRCWSVCDKLVTLDNSDQQMKEPITLFMPQDKLEMTFDVRIVLAVNPDKYDLLFTKVPSVKAGNGYVVPLHKAYSIYAQQVVLTISREIMSKYTIAEVVANREAIGAKLSSTLVKEVETNTPFIVRYAGLADVAYPAIITKAQERAAERREQIAEEEAKTQKRLIELERELTEAQKQRKVDVEKAQAEAEVNRILADSITPAYVKYKQLEALQEISKSDNTKFVPVEMLSSMAGQVMLGK